MEFFDQIVQKAVSFFALTEIIGMIHSGDYSQLATHQGLIAVVRPLFPVVTMFEFLAALANRRLRFVHYKIAVFCHILNSIVGKFISITVVAFCIGLFEKYAIFKTGLTWYWFLYGYVVWELGHFIFHFLSHKVRLFWCLHSTHHVPQNMNLSINFAHFFFEMPFANIIRTSTCILLGVNPIMLLIIMFIDGTWGGFVHMSESISKTGKLGFLSKFILTPMHHRIHHAKNPLYIDTNFCNLLNIWDHIFRTYQTTDPGIKIEYGITRKIKPHSFFDSYFGEFISLGKDVYRAPGLKNKFLYVIMPPGWSHIGRHKTAAREKKSFIESRRQGKQLLTKPLLKPPSNSGPGSVPGVSTRRY